jgi:hypothetical protein
MVVGWSIAMEVMAFACLDAKIVQDPPCHAAVQVAQVQGICGRVILTVAHQDGSDRAGCSKEFGECMPTR